MPVAKRPQTVPRTLVERLAAQAEVKPVNNILSLDRYQRSALLLLNQAKAYREAGNDEQLYVMLLRYLSLVLETIPKHKDFVKTDSTYTSLKKGVRDKYLPEMEELKIKLTTKESPIIKAPDVASKNRPADVVPLTVSQLPQIDWTSVDSPMPGAGQPSEEFTLESRAFQGILNSQGINASTVQNYSSAAPYFPPPTYSGSGDLFDMLINSAVPPTSVSEQAATRSVPAELPMLQYSKSYASRPTDDRHSLFTSRPTLSPTPSPVLAASASLPRYPTFTPAFNPPPVPSISQSASPSQLQAGPLTDALHSLAMPSAPPASATLPAITAAAVSYPAPPQNIALPPQQLQVHNISPHQAQLLPDTCTACPQRPPAAPGQPPPPPSVPSDSTAVVPAGGVKEYVKTTKLRDVHISLGLMNDFLHFANNNTRKGIESCGILAGRLSANDSIFTLTTLIIPKQEGTTDTVQALNEEEIFMVQFEKELYPLGWIHTHPTQTCFLSSVDVHTQVGYQTMLDEAIAIVMAPSDRSQKCGIFRLTTPGGLELIQQCALRGFHTHPPTSTGQPLYDIAQHVYMNERVKFEVIDLRNK